MLPSLPVRRPDRSWGSIVSAPATVRTRPAWTCLTLASPPISWPGPSTMGLSNTDRWDDTVANCQHQRDALTTNRFQLALSTARLAPLSTGLEALYRAAADQPEAVRQIFGVLGGPIPIADTYEGEHQ